MFSSDKNYNYNYNYSAGTLNCILYVLYKM